jgi:hypothetical protein
MKSLIPEKVSGFRSAVINRLIDWAKSMTIIPGPGLLMRETEAGTEISLQAQKEVVKWMPFDIQLSWVIGDSNFHVLVYMPLSGSSFTPGAEWMRGGATAADYGAATNSATSAWPIGHKPLPTGWIDTGITISPGDGPKEIYAWVSTGGSFVITDSPSLLTFDTAGNTDAKNAGLQKHLATVADTQKVTQLFDGAIEEMGVVPL